MATADIGRTYAMIKQNICIAIFTRDTLPEWNNDMCPAVDVTGNIPKIGDIYNGVNFVTPTPLVLAPKPDGTAFAQDIKANIGGILVANSLMVAYPAFFPAIQSGAWNDVQTLTIDALAKGVLTQTQYGVIKNSAATYFIPITLP